MGYVFAAATLASWTALAFVYRWANARKVHRYALLAGYGVVALALDVAWSVMMGADPRTAGAAQWVFGAALGAATVAALPILMAAVARGELAITWTIFTLAFALTSAVSIFYPDGSANAFGVGGLVLAAGAVALLGLDERRLERDPHVPGARKGWGKFMAAAFLLNAACLYFFRLGSHFARPVGNGPGWDEKLAFLAAAHGVMLVSGVVLYLATRRADGTRAALAPGLVGGTVIFCGGMFSVLALSAPVPGYVFFPMTNGGSALLVTILSVLLLKERPGRMGWLGVAAGVAALALLGLAQAFRNP